MNRPTDAIQAAIRRLQAAQQRLAEIEAEEARLAEEKRAILAEVAGSSDSTLTPRHGYDTVDSPMSSANVSELHPGPVADGEVAKLAAELGLPSLARLAEALGEPYTNVRNWNTRGRWPARVNGAIEKLRAASKRKSRRA